MRILLVEDQATTSDYLKKGLSEHGFTVDVAATGTDGPFLREPGDRPVRVSIA